MSPESEETLTVLLNILLPPPCLSPKKDQAGQIVLLLGAGCSRQYGLPGFVELLSYLFEDWEIDPHSRAPSSLEALRDRLDKSWQAQGPERLQRALKYYLGRVNGVTCPGYMLLAELARAGHIKAIINMNFDTLLEEALVEREVPFQVLFSFASLHNVDETVIVYKPHGTIATPLEDIGIEKILSLNAAWSQKEEKELKRRCDMLTAHARLFAEPGKIYQFVDKLLEVPRNPPATDMTKTRADLRDLREQNSMTTNFVIDIANSDLFSATTEQQAAEKLLTDLDVLSIGYFGADAKIAASLKAFQGAHDKRNRKLIAVNTLRPDAHLLVAMAERASQNLLITGEDGAFENFMERLMKNLAQKKNRDLRRERAEESFRTFLIAAERMAVDSQDDIEGSPQEKDLAKKGIEVGNSRLQNKRRTERPLNGPPNYMTQEEREGLQRCLGLALNIRLSFNVAERSLTSIEQHGYAIFEFCNSLAQHAGICLSSAEKYALHCAAFLHDLGYYRGYSSDLEDQYPGWKLLRNHGELIGALLRERLTSNPDLDIKPKTYVCPEKWPAHFYEVIRNLCEAHTGLVKISDEIASELEIEIDGISVPFRFDLLVSLFSLAEDLAEGHPFYPSPDPIGYIPNQHDLSITDPVLDLYLKRKEKIVHYEIDKGRVTARTIAKDNPAAANWLLSMAAVNVSRFDRAVINYGGWGIKFYDRPQGLPESIEPTDPTLQKFIVKLLRQALTESLQQASKVTPLRAKASALLDLLAIYTLDAGEDTREPRVSIHKMEVREILADANNSTQRESRPSLLAKYFDISLKKDDRRSRLEDAFLDSYSSIIYPAWRLFARNWHDRVESILMAVSCLELGSSQFRKETAAGIQYLLGDENVVTWNGDKAYGHEGCTLCTSRLLYIFAHASRFFDRGEICTPHATDGQKRTLEEAIAGILRYFLSLDAKDLAWSGVKYPPTGSHPISSADYLAWAAKSVTHTLATEEELSSPAGNHDGSWLSRCGLNEKQKHKLPILVSQRWENLFFSQSDLLGKYAEEPHSLILGSVASACLDASRLPKVVAEITDWKAKVSSLAKNLKKGLNIIQPLSNLSIYTSLPVYLLADGMNTDEPTTHAIDAFKIFDKLRHSPFILKRVRARAVFNVRNTLTIVMSLVAFWNHVLADENQPRFEPLFEKGVSAPEVGAVHELDAEIRVDGHARSKVETSSDLPEPLEVPRRNRRGTQVVEEAR